MKNNESKTASETKKDFQDAKLKVWYEEKNGSVCWYADNSDNLKTKTIKTSRGCGRISKTVGNPWKKISKKAAAEILANYGWTTDEFIDEYKKMEDEQSAILSRIRQETVIKYYVVTEEAMEVAIEAEINNASKAGEIVSTDNNLEVKAEVEINAVASYTLSAMCEEDAIRTEIEINEALELKELNKSAESQKVRVPKKAAKKMTETEHQQKWLENAKIDENGKMHVHILYEECGNDCMAYLINNKDRKIRIASKFAYQLLNEGRAIKITANKAA